MGDGAREGVGACLQTPLRILLQPRRASACASQVGFEGAEQEFGHRFFGLPGDSRLSGPARTDTEKTRP